jgi:hypothetical protein
MQDVRNFVMFEKATCPYFKGSSLQMALAHIDVDIYKSILTVWASVAATFPEVS